MAGLEHRLSARVPSHHNSSVTPWLHNAFPSGLKPNIVISWLLLHSYCDMVLVVSVASCGWYCMVLHGVVWLFIVLIVCVDSIIQASIFSMFSVQ